MHNNISMRLNKVIDLARETALQLGQDTVYPEHFFLGFIRLGEGTAISVLKKIGVDLVLIKKEIEANLKKDEILIKLGLIPISHEGDRLLARASDESKDMHSDVVGTEHLLLAMSRSKSFIGKLLARYEVNYQVIKKALLDLISGPESNHAEEEKSKKSKTPSIDTYSKDLTLAARNGKLDPVIGREKEIERVIQILSRRKKNNPVLIGEPGTGKTAIVEGLALRISKGKAPASLLNKRIVALDLGLIIAGTKYRGQFEERIKEILNEVDKEKNLILFLDEIHTIVGAGSTSGSIDASNMFKPALARGEIQCIGATTLDEYRTTIEKDGALERRFQKVLVEPSTIDQTISILYGLKERYENHHKVRYSNEAMKAAVIMSNRYITERFLPDKAIDVIDEAGARKHLSIKLPSIIDNYEKNIEVLSSQKEALISGQKFEKAAEVRDKMAGLKDRLDHEKEKWLDKINSNYLSIDEEDIAEVISMMTSIPVSKLKTPESKRLGELEKILEKKIIQQNKAIISVVKRIRRARAGFKNPDRPIGSFLFLGPTGVGKTELAKVLAEELFDNPASFIKVDMSEYMEKFNVSKMIGSPPGYVGYDEGGQLSEKVRRHPYSVVLFDEIEKAHPDVFGMLLQVLDEGILTDGNGRKIDFKNTIIIFTSNIGTSELSKSENIGFGTSDSAEKKHNRMVGRINNQLKNYFKPEFLNRIDEMIIFEHLGDKAVIDIIDKHIEESKDSLKDNNISLEVSSTVKEYILENYYDLEKGARPLRRAVEEVIEDPIAEKIIKGEFFYGDLIKIVIKDDEPEYIRVERKLEIQEKSRILERQ